MSPTTATWTDTLIDSGYLPHAVIRIGIRRLLAERMAMIASTSLTASYERKMAYVSALRSRPIAINTAEANQQHYEVGTSILQGMLGPRMKYSACLYPTGKETLAQAEIAMLELYVERAELVDGQKILDLGCGWGSLTLYLAERFPKSNITGFSNSRTQRQHIMSIAESKGLKNVEVITGDVVDYQFPEKAFDRVVSIELFEHMKNYALLLQKVSHALKAAGKVFVHIFSHKDSPYDFDAGWMSEHFFTGGTMPSADLLLYFQDELAVKKQWWVNGRHYAKTCEDWLLTMAKNRVSIMTGLEETYGKEGRDMWWRRWEVFYMACAELFAYRGGDEWGVAHYLFEKKGH